MILTIHTVSGDVVSAPFEAWLVAVINALPPERQAALYRAVKRAEGASLIPERFKMFEDELGTMQIEERPLIDLGGK